MDTGRVIDLGLAASPPGDAPDDGRPASGRRRRILAAWIGVVLAIVLTGPARHGATLVPVWQVEAYHGFFLLGDDTVYTLVETGAEVRLVASRLRTGAPRWQRALDGPLVDLYRGQPALLLPRFPPRPGLRTVTRVQEAASGRLVGTYPVPAMPVAYFAADVAVLIDREPGAPETGPGPVLPWYDGWRHPHRVTGVDLATGADRWAASIGPGSFWALPGLRPWADGLVATGTRAPWMAVFGPDGGTEVWDLATGAVLARGRVELPDERSYAVALPDALVVHTSGPQDAVLTGYDPWTLAVRWRFSLADLPDSAAWPVACAPLVCLASGYALWGIDPGSGRLAWRQPVADVYTAANELLATGSIDGLGLVEAVTGRRYALRSWQVLDRQPRPGALVVARAAEPGSRIEIGVITPGRSRVTSLGEVEPPGPRGPCRAIATHVACVDRDQLRVWRIRT